MLLSKGMNMTGKQSNSMRKGNGKLLSKTLKVFVSLQDCM